MGAIPEFDYKIEKPVHSRSIYNADKIRALAYNVNGMVIVCSHLLVPSKSNVMRGLMQDEYVCNWNCLHYVNLQPKLLFERVQWLPCVVFLVYFARTCQVIYIVMCLVLLVDAAHTCMCMFITFRLALLYYNLTLT